MDYQGRGRVRLRDCPHPAHVKGPGGWLGVGMVAARDGDMKMFSDATTVKFHRGQSRALGWAGGEE